MNRTTYHPGPYADGVFDGLSAWMPGEPSPTPDQLAPPPVGRPAQWRGTLRRARTAEGPRGVAIRTSVALRYVGYVFTILLGATLANAAFAGTAWRLAGTLVLFSSSLMCVTAAGGTLFMPHKRSEIIEDLRHFMFQLSLIPATGIAGFDWVVRSYGADPRNQDNFLGLLQNSLPLLYAFTVFIPAIVFVKAVAGRRHLERTQQDDEEAMNTWTRQDWFVR
jgi:hypothetical protein